VLLVLVSTMTEVVKNRSLRNLRHIRLHHDYFSKWTSC